MCVVVSHGSVMVLVGVDLWVARAGHVWCNTLSCPIAKNERACTRLPMVTIGK